MTITKNDDYMTNANIKRKLSILSSVLCKINKKKQKNKKKIKTKNERLIHSTYKREKN